MYKAPELDPHELHMFAWDVVKAHDAVGFRASGLGSLRVLRVAFCAICHVSFSSEIGS